MLDLEKLFKIRPFVFYVRGDYFAFGSGVCMRYNNQQRNPIMLPLRYEKYQDALKHVNITQKDAWDAYRRVNAIAENNQSIDDYPHLQKKFEQLQFSDEEKESIQQQLDQVETFFRKNHLCDYY